MLKPDLFATGLTDVRMMQQPVSCHRRERSLDDLVNPGLEATITLRVRSGLPLAEGLLGEFRYPAGHCDRNPDLIGILGKVKDRRALHLGLMCHERYATVRCINLI